jgi:CRISPR-associated protein Cas1
MTTLYLTDERAFVRKQHDTLLVGVTGGESRRVPLTQVTEVCCCGDISWSGAALRELAAVGIAVAYIGPRGEWVGRWEPTEPKTVPLRRAQFRASDDSARCLAIAAAIVAGKIRNSRALLMRARREGMLVAAPEIDDLAAFAARLPQARDLDTLRGLEGEAAARYFAAYGRLVTAHGFSFTRRVRRPPTDPVNALLSFGYALLAHTTATAVRAVGFDAHIGFLHADRYGRESLALDVMEEFRPVVVDALVAVLINKRVLALNDFLTDATACRLTDTARRRFIEMYERKLASELLHPVIGDRVDHRRAIHLQARILAKYLTGEIPHYVPFAKR